MRPLLWSVAWTLGAQTFAEHALGWPWWAQILFGLPFAVVALLMAVHHSIAWRLAIVRHWDKMQRPMVYDEDGALRTGMLSFERVHVLGDEHGPIEGHVHTRTLVLGRPRLRAETVWRRVE